MIVVLKVVGLVELDTDREGNFRFVYRSMRLGGYVGVKRVIFLGEKIEV